MATITLTLRGDQIGTYDYYYGNGNGNARVVTVEGVEAIGTSSDIYTVVVEQVNSGVSEFQNGQFVTIYDSDGNIIVDHAVVQPDLEQGLGAGDEHLLLASAGIYIDLNGLEDGVSSVKLGNNDEKGDTGIGDNDGNLDFTEVAASNSFVCYTPGTLIETPDGPVPVEFLKEGGRVSTSWGPLEVMWIGTRKLFFGDQDHDQRPILVPAGALGGGKPSRDLILSPQHRIRLSGPVVNQVCGTPAVLAPVKGLIALPGVRQMRGRRDVTYISVLLERHAVMLAEDTPAESLYPGPWAMKTLGRKLCGEIYRKVPALLDDPLEGYGPHALPLLTVRETEKLAHVMRPAFMSAPEDVDQRPARLC